MTQETAGYHRTTIENLRILGYRREMTDQWDEYRIFSPAGEDLGTFTAWDCGVMLKTRHPDAFVAVDEQPILEGLEHLGKYVVRESPCDPFAEEELLRLVSFETAEEADRFIEEESRRFPGREYTLSVTVK